MLERTKPKIQEPLLQYICDECDFTCHHQTELEKHMLQHKPEEDILFCDHCDFTSTSETDYDGHIEKNHRDIFEEYETVNEAEIKKEPEDFVANLVNKLATELESDDEEDIESEAEEKKQVEQKEQAEEKEQVEEKEQAEEKEHAEEKEQVEEKEQSEEKEQAIQDMNTFLTQKYTRPKRRVSNIKKEPETTREVFADPLKNKLTETKLSDDDYEFSDDDYEGDMGPTENGQEEVKQDIDYISDDLLSRIDQLITKHSEPSIESPENDPNSISNAGISARILAEPTTDYKFDKKDAIGKTLLQKLSESKYFRDNPTNLKTFNPSFSQFSFQSEDSLLPGWKVMAGGWKVTNKNKVFLTPQNMLIKSSKAVFEYMKCSGEKYSNQQVEDVARYFGDTVIHKYSYTVPPTKQRTGNKDINQLAEEEIMKVANPFRKALLGCKL